MKTKGITVWEKHAEKFVLAIAFVAAIGFSAMQFIGEPNAVSTSAGEIAPGDIDQVLQERADQLLALLRDDAPAGVEIPYPILGFDDLLAQRDRSLTPEAVLPPFQMALAPSVVGVGIGKSLKLSVPVVKKPDRVAVGQYAEALADGVVELYPDLQERFRPGEPHDMVYATIRARFDLADLRREFLGEGQTDAARIPSSWYNDRPEHIVDVLINREEYVDGQWTDPVTLETIPGQVSVRREISGELFAKLRDDVLDRLSDPAYQFAVIQPPFYETRSDDWTVPEWHDAGAPVDDDAARIRILRNRLSQQDATRAELIDQLKDAGGSMDDEREEDRGSGPPRGGGTGRRAPPGGGKRAPPGSGSGFGESSGPKTGRRQGGDSDPREDKEKLIKRLKREIRRTDRSIMKTERDLRALGADPDAQEAQDDPFAALESDEILVWGHDLTVKPGKTYRYRVTVSVYNPFFGKKRSLVDDQQSLAEVFVLNSEPSEWSGPVRIHSLRRVFITSATKGGPGVQVFGRAMVEVYLFYDGVQRMEKFSVTPGAAIGGVKDGIDFGTRLFVLDIVQDIKAGERNRGPDARGAVRVLLQDLDDPQRLELRDPRIEETDPDRLRLRAKLPATGPRSL